MLRRRPVRPLVALRERIAIAVVIAACALSTYVGSQLAEGVAEVMPFDGPAETGLVEPPRG